MGAHEGLSQRTGWNGDCPKEAGLAEIVMKKECVLSSLSAILVACFLGVGAAHAGIPSKDPETKKRLELTVVEKKPEQKPARGNEPQKQQPQRRR